MTGKLALKTPGKDDEQCQDAHCAQPLIETHFTPRSLPVAYIRRYPPW